jgi:hypothetical protein
LQKIKFFREGTPAKKDAWVKGGDYRESGGTLRSHPARRENRSSWRQCPEKRTLFFAITYPSLKMIIRILISVRIQATQTIIQATFLAKLARSMNKVNMIRNPTGSIRLSGKTVRGNID